jgi:DNA polymerase
MEMRMYESLQDVRAAVMACDRCGLCAARQNTVFGAGREDARVMLVGEGPGANEDATGEPFVGRAGELLDRMLLAAGFSRQQNVYITNIVKCRPPENRDPSPQEAESCMAYLRWQFKLIRPEYVVCLGRIAAQRLIAPDFLVTRRHGEFIEKNGVTLMATYHPAALLRNPNNKPEALDDFLKLRDKIASDKTPK